MASPFDKTLDSFRDWALQLGRLQTHLEALHKYAIAETSRVNAPPNVEAAAYGSASNNTPPPAPAPTPTPKWGGGRTTAAPPSETKIFDPPPGWGKPRNDNHNFQNPAPGNAKQLPPPPTPQEAKDRVHSYVSDMRAMAIHFVNCAHLMATIADVLEPALRKRR